MKYVRYQYDGTVSYGLLEGDAIAPLVGSPFGSFTVAAQRLPASAVRLLSPCLPSKALCIGLNYRDHAQEMKVCLPSSPVVFLKPATALIGPGEGIVHPAISKRVDYEAELVIVIKRTARHVAEGDADRYILGYTCGNDVTARDLQVQDGQWTIPKGFDTFMPLGPVITDEVDSDNLPITTRLNGVVKQASNTANLIFKCRYLVSYLSNIMTLLPGDVIMTGTPGGIGPMRIGDVVEIDIAGVGVLSNPVVG